MFQELFLDESGFITFVHFYLFMGKSLLTLDIKKSFIALKGYFDGINEIWGKEKEYL